jgi:hypothetical protein
MPSPCLSPRQGDVLKTHGSYDGIVEFNNTYYLKEFGMTLFMDIHKKVEGATTEAVAGAHKRDVEVQEKYGVQYLKYWFDESSGTIFCLIEAPDKETAEQVHREAHGLMADELHEVGEFS